MDFQQAIMRLNQFWANHGCVLWQPHNVQVGAGTMNPATVLRVLGPEPWNVAYVEPSARPDDGRYGENPNRWQQYFQYQVVLKPDPGNPQELYLESLRDLGVDTSKHDVRFVEDAWESPALGAWGLGWEVWLDGQEISQYTYFQQSGGQALDPVSVELTYGLERIVMVLQGVRGIPAIRWRNSLTYGELLLRGEIESCIYNFEVADVDNLHRLYDLCEEEAKKALGRQLVMPAHDYVLKCSHIFNVLDARGAVGVTERARYFVRMRDLARQVATLFLEQRAEQGYPLRGKLALPDEATAPLQVASAPSGEGPFDFVLEIGSEELPVADLAEGLAQLEARIRDALDESRLAHGAILAQGTPRRLVALVKEVHACQSDEERVIKGPPAQVAFDSDGNPTRAAQGFARSQGVDVTKLQRRRLEGKEYAVAVVVNRGRPAQDILAERLPSVVAAIKFPQNMRWNASGCVYSRPLRWYVALLGDAVVPFEYAGVRSGRVSRGIRPQGSPDLTVARASDYLRDIASAGIMLDVRARQDMIRERADALASEVGGQVPEDVELVREVASLVEFPLAIRGAFDEEYLKLPDAVLLAVMRKHQRYIPIVSGGHLLPYFVAIANGATLDQDAVRHGNEEVLRARYADAAFFYRADAKRRLEEFTADLSTLTFQEQLGSVLDKVGRIVRLVPELSSLLQLPPEERAAALRAAALCKTDLATKLVVELTSLQGVMGQHYAQLSGEPAEVALAIAEHYLPRSAGDKLPASTPGAVVGLADRLDTLVGLFSVGIRPTGAADPWGLRRTALGLVQLLIGKQIRLSLPVAFSLAAATLPVKANNESVVEAADFVKRRFRGYLVDSGPRYDMVDAVLAERGHDLYWAYQTLQGLAPWIARPDWGELLDTYARCVRITRGESVVHIVDEGLLRDPDSQALYEAYARAAHRVQMDGSVNGLFEALLGLKPAIRAFFDRVLVMADDVEVRNTRLGLLQSIGRLTEGIVDLTLMEGF